MNRLASRLVTVVLVAIGFTALADRAQAADRPYKATGTASLAGLTLTGEGNATHLGHYSEAGNVTSVVPVSAGVLAVTVDITYTTDEGYELHATAAGTLNFNTRTISGNVTYNGGTGRFSDATGSAIITGQILQDGSFAVRVNGNIDF